MLRFLLNFFRFFESFARGLAQPHQLCYPPACVSIYKYTYIYLYTRVERRNPFSLFFTSRFPFQSSRTSVSLFCFFFRMNFCRRSLHSCARARAGHPRFFEGGEMCVVEHCRRLSLAMHNVAPAGVGSCVIKCSMCSFYFSSWICTLNLRFFAYLCGIV